MDKYEIARELLRRRTRLKETSLTTYISGLRTICEYANVESPFALVEKGLEFVEDITEEWIRAHEHTLAPKHLNMVYCAVKTWCKATRLIKSRRLFREIDFDKTSRKTEALLEKMITTEQIRKGFEIIPINHKVDLGLYTLLGLRPSLIPSLKVKAKMWRKGATQCGQSGFHERSITLENGKLKFTRKPAILIITRTDEKGMPRKGNKGNITFFSFVPTKLCELIETFVNARANTNNEVVTEDTSIVDSKDEKAVYWKAKEFYRKIGFEGRPYLLRKFGDRILERITHKYNDEDFKEALMGHKGKISAIYQIAGLTEEDEKHYREMYVEACDNWINENIFGTITKEQLDKAEMLVKFARQLGVNETETAPLLEAFKNAKIDIRQFEAKLTELTNKALDNRMMRNFEQLYLKMEAKHNNH